MLILLVAQPALPQIPAQELEAAPAHSPAHLPAAPPHQLAQSQQGAREPPEKESRSNPPQGQSKDRQGVDKRSIQELMERAEEHFFSQRYNVALQLFEVIIKRDPENARAYRFAGDAYLLQGKLKEAEERFHVARELSQEPQEEWFRIAQTRILAKDGKKAEEALHKALALKPDMHLCHFYLGLVAYRLFRDKEKAITHWENYIKSNPADKKKVERAIAILKDKNYVIPYRSDHSDIDDHPQPSRYSR